MTTIHQPNATSQPLVTESNIRNELEYWLSQMPLDKLLTIIAQKCWEVGRRRVNKGQYEWVGVSKALEALSELAFQIRSLRS